VASSDAVIVISGRAGTLSELAIASLLNKPIIALIKGRGVAKIAEKLAEEGIINPIYEAETPKKAVEKAINTVTKKRKKE
jgi:predicted Rossmann-fold nucleotide-binding protein